MWINAQALSLLRWCGGGKFCVCVLVLVCVYCIDNALRVVYRRLAWLGVWTGRSVTRAAAPPLRLRGHVSDINVTYGGDVSRRRTSDQRQPYTHTCQPLMIALLFSPSVSLCRRLSFIRLYSTFRHSTGLHSHEYSVVIATRERCRVFKLHLLDSVDLYVWKLV